MRVTSSIAVRWMSSHTARRASMVGASNQASRSASRRGMVGQPGQPCAVAAHEGVERRVDEIEAGEAGEQRGPAALVQRLAAGAALHDRAPIRQRDIGVEAEAAGSRIFCTDWNCRRVFL